MLPLEGSKEGKKKGVKKLVFAKFKVKITKGHYEASTVDDLRRPGLSPAFFFRLFSLLTFHNFTSNASGQPFLFTSHSAHPLPLERCKVNISIGLQWPVSAALIPTLLFEGSIVPDLLAWFACLWIMAEEPQSGLLPSTHCSLSGVWSLKTYKNYCDIPLWYRAPHPRSYTMWRGLHWYCNVNYSSACSTAPTQVLNPSLHWA